MKSWLELSMWEVPPICLATNRKGQQILRDSLLLTVLILPSWNSVQSCEKKIEGKT